MVSMPAPPVVPPPTVRPRPPMFQVDPGPDTVTAGVPGLKRYPSISAPNRLSSTPPLLITSAEGPGSKTPTPVNPSTVTIDPGPETTMLVATRRSLSMRSEPPSITDRVPPNTDTPCPPSTRSEPPLIVSPPARQSQRVRSPPIRPMLPPLLAPVRVSVVAPSSSSREPVPEKEPEKVLLVPPAMVRKPKVVGAMTTVPPPDGPSAREPLVMSVPSPKASVDPTLT